MFIEYKLNVSSHKDHHKTTYRYNDIIICIDITLRECAGSHDIDGR